MTDAATIIEETAKHFMVPRDVWCGSNSRAKRDVIIRHVACAVAVRLSVDIPSFAKAISLEEDTIGDVGRKAAYKHSMHVADVLTRIQKIVPLAAGSAT